MARTLTTEDLDAIRDALTAALSRPRMSDGERLARLEARVEELERRLGGTTP